MHKPQATLPPLRRLRVITYRVTLDVPLQLVIKVSNLLRKRRKELGTRNGTRALTCYQQAVFILAWFRDRPDLSRLGQGFGISQATAYRCKDRPYLKKVPILADSGYEGAGAGVLVPVKKPRNGELDINTKTRNMLLRGARYQGERAFALTSQRRRAIRHVSADPSRIGDIAKSVLVLTQFEHKMIS